MSYHIATPDLRAHPLVRIWNLPLSPKEPLHVLEALVHEISHWTMALGQVPEMEPGMITGMTNHLGKLLGKREGDMNEIETSALTCRVMLEITGVNPREMREYCLDSMWGVLGSLMGEEEVLKHFNRVFRRKSTRDFAEGILEKLVLHGVLVEEPV